ncbi:MAG: citB [Anaerocolumna sp.]|nr:citB [Anaerocolumna sp.]
MDNLKEKSYKSFESKGQTYHYYSLKALEEWGYEISSLPFSIKILIEAALRQLDNDVITIEHIERLAGWRVNKEQVEVPFKPSRVILQDFTGVPAVVDLASMRNASANPKLINPDVRVDLVIDHSVSVDSYGKATSLNENIALEFTRNKERYEFLKWAQGAFHNFRVIPPGGGIIHQVNLEYLADVVSKISMGADTVLFPDTLVGTDSHTTMINGLGVLGWGVGGIEAEAGMLGQPSYFPLPEVIGVRLKGKLKTGATATDLALKVTSVLRQKGVVNKFVEFFGEGAGNLTLSDRATIANMAPEYGATCSYFPVDEKTLEFLALSGRSEEQIDLIKEYLSINQMFLDKNSEEPVFTDVVEIDLNEIGPSIAGPKRPQDFIPLNEVKHNFLSSVTGPLGNKGYGLTEKEIEKKTSITLKDGRNTVLRTGDVCIAAITSCTNTSNPYVMLGAGLLAKNAVEKGLKVAPYVKTSLSPGSKVVTDYLNMAGLSEYLDQLGFQTVGYGCATCIGNSGALLPEIEEGITKEDLLVSSVLSGNRNFEGRIHPLLKANYLASPMLVVAYALAGTIITDMDKDPVGFEEDGKPVYLADIWPSSKEINEMISRSIAPEMYIKEYKKIYEENKLWNDIPVKGGLLYEFLPNSTYIQNPPFFTEVNAEHKDKNPHQNMRIVGIFGDTVTTDHISPAGTIGKNTPAGKFLLEQGVKWEEFNTYGSRRGNHEVMMRGTFANVRLRNQIAQGTEGGYTTYYPTGEVMPIFDACMKYKEDKTPLIILAGKDYGMGSSRDWAAKGTNLLGIKVVIAESYERIHRSNLVMMGVLPLEFVEGESSKSLGITGEEIIHLKEEKPLRPKEIISLLIVKPNGEIKEFRALVRIDSEIEANYYKQGGILPMVLKKKQDNII